MMQYLDAMANRWWFEPVLVLSVGTVLIVVTTLGVCAVLNNAVFQRRAWQTALLGLIGLSLLEITGTGQALVALTGNGLSKRDISVATDTFSNDNEERRGERLNSKSGPARFDPSAQRERSEAIRILRPQRSTQADINNANVGDEAYSGDLTTIPGGSDIRMEARRELWQFDEMTVTTGDRNWMASAAVDFEPAPVPIGTIRLASGGFLGGGGNRIGGAVVACEWILALLWVIGSILCVGKIIWTTALLTLFRRNHSRAADESLRRRVGELSGRLELRRPPRVLISDRLRAPVAFGIWRPTVILPASFSDQFSSVQQDTILSHEVAHLASGDPVWKLVANLTCAALWWHPPAWYVRRRFEAACETAADHASLMVPGGPGILADCLVRLGQSLSSSGRLGWHSMAGEGFRSTLAQRVLRLLNLKNHSWQPPRRTRYACVAASLLTSFLIIAESGTVWARPKVSLPTSTKGTDMSILTTSWRQSLAAAALLAFVGADSNSLADEPQAEPVEVAVVLEIADEPQAEPVEVTVELEAADELAEDALELDVEVEEVEEREERGPVVVEEHVIIQKGNDPRVENQQRRIVVTRKKKQKDDAAEGRVRVERERAALEKRLSRLQDRARQLRSTIKERREGEDFRNAERQLDESQRAIAEISGRLARDHARRERALTRGRQDPLSTDLDLRKVSPVLGRPDDDRGDLHNYVRGMDERQSSEAGLARRLEHLHAAAKNLQEAGLHEQAEQLVQQAQQMERDLRAQRGYVADEQPRDRYAGPHPEHLEQAVHELRAHLEQMRREMQEVRNELRQALERLERNELHRHDQQPSSSSDYHRDHSQHSALDDGHDHGDDFNYERNEEHSGDNVPADEGRSIGHSEDSVSRP